MGRSHLHTYGKLYGLKHHRSTIDSAQCLVTLLNLCSGHLDVLLDSSRQQHWRRLSQISVTLLPNIRSNIYDYKWDHDCTAIIHSRFDCACIYFQSRDHKCASPVLATHADLPYDPRSLEASHQHVESNKNLVLCAHRHIYCILVHWDPSCTLLDACS